MSITAIYSYYTQGSELRNKREWARARDRR